MEWFELIPVKAPEEIKAVETGERDLQEMPWMPLPTDLAAEVCMATRPQASQTANPARAIRAWS